MDPRTLLEIQITWSFRIPRVLSNIRSFHLVDFQAGDTHNKIIMVNFMMIVGCEIHPICLIPSSSSPLIISSGYHAIIQTGPA